jgi:Uma2 family endonuclease
MSWRKIMVVHKKVDTAEEFDEWASLPDNADRRLEFIGGEIVEVPSNPYSSSIASRINMFIGMYLLQNDIGHLTGEGGGYMVSGERYAPDVAFISRQRQPELVREGYNPNPPELVVEVISPTDSQKNLRIKVANYLAAGTQVWVVYPDDQEVEVYRPGQPVLILDHTGTLEGAPTLPGFRLPVRDVFPE